MDKNWILVTGGCGFIGSHIVKALSESGENVIVFDNFTQGSQSALLHGEEVIQGDIRSNEELDKVFNSRPIETVIHCAALVNAAESGDKEDEYRDVNDLGSRNVWQAAVKAGVKHYLYASSAAVYGTPASTDPITEDAPVKPTNVYGETKLAGEVSLSEEVRAGNYLVFRFFNVGGAEKKGRLGQSKESRAIMQRLFAAAHGEVDAVTISGTDYDTPDGTVVRDFIHVEDIADAFIKGIDYLRKGGKSEILNLGGGKTSTIRNVIDEVQKVTGNSIPLSYGPRVPGDISYSLADIGKAKKIVGWKPRHTMSDIVRDGWNAYAKRA